MFDVGSKIKVLNSSVKGSGPRKGSTGYVASCSLDILPRVGVLSQMVVYFNRYGKELTDRCERKTIVNILPIEKELRKGIRELSSKQANDNLTKILRNYVPIAVVKASRITAVPAQMEDIRKVSKQEQFCWLRSILHAESHTNDVRNWMMATKNTSLLPATNEDLHLFMVFSGALKADIENNLHIVPKFIRLVHMLRTIKVIGKGRKKHTWANINNALRRISVNGNIIGSAKEEKILVAYLLRFIFKDDELYLLIQKYNNTRAYNGRSTEAVIKKVLELKKKLMALSEK